MSAESCGGAAAAKGGEASHGHEGHRGRGEAAEGHEAPAQQHYHHYYYFYPTGAVPPGVAMPEGARPHPQPSSPPPAAPAYAAAPVAAVPAAGQPPSSPTVAADQPGSAAMDAPAPADEAPGQQPMGDGFLKGMLVGAGVSFLLTNEAVQKNLIRTAVRLWSVAQGGVEEVKERFRDAEAEIKAGTEKH